MSLQTGSDGAVDETNLPPHLRKLAPSKMEHKLQVNKSNPPAQMADLGLGVNGAPLPPQLRNMPIIDKNGPDDQEAICDHCKLVLANDTALAKHKMDRMLANEGHHHCHICYMDYHAKATLVNHMRTVHPTPQDLNCPGCNSHFERLAKLVAHLENDECPVIRASQIAEARETNLEFACALKSLARAPIVTFGDDEEEAARYRCYMDPNSVAPVFFAIDNFKRKTNTTYEVEVQIPADGACSDGNACQGPGWGEDKTKNATKSDDTWSECSGWGEAKTKNATKPDDTWSECSGWGEAKTKNATKPDVTWSECSGWGEAKDESDTASGGNSAQSSAEVNDKNETAPVGPAVKLVMVQDLLDPAHPSFRIQDHWDKWLKKYLCPEAYCGPNQLINHLYSAAHGRGIKLTCPYCNRHFGSVLALIQHAESQSTRCGIRHALHSGLFFNQATGGIAEKAGYHTDGTVMYKVTPEAQERYGVGKQRYGFDQTAATMKREEEKQEQEQKGQEQEQKVPDVYDTLLHMFETKQG